MEEYQTQMDKETILCYMNIRSMRFQVNLNVKMNEKGIELEDTSRAKIKSIASTSSLQCSQQARTSPPKMMPDTEGGCVVQHAVSMADKFQQVTSLLAHSPNSAIALLNAEQLAQLIENRTVTGLPAGNLMPIIAELCMHFKADYCNYRSSL